MTKEKEYVIILTILYSLLKYASPCDFPVNWRGSWIYSSAGEYHKYNITQNGYSITNVTKSTSQYIESYTCPYVPTSEQGWTYFVKTGNRTGRRQCAKAKQVQDVLLMFNRYDNQDNLTSSDCSQGSIVADIVFVLDTSSSICAATSSSVTTCRNFELLKTFTANIVDKLSIGENAARIGLVSFSDNAVNEFYLHDHYDKKSIKEAIFRTRYSLQATNTSSGIYAMHKQQFIQSRGDRPDVQNIGIIITDGRSTLSTDKVKPFAMDAQTNGIRMIAVGINITSNISIEELITLSSPPKLMNQTYFLTPDFTTLNAILETIVNEACMASALTPFRCIKLKYLQPARILHRYPVHTNQKCSFGSDGTHHVTLNMTQQQLCRHDNSSIATIYRNHLYFDTCEKDWPLQTATLWCLSTINSTDFGDTSNNDNIQLLYRQDRHLGKFYCTRYRTLGGQATLTIDSRENAPMNCGLSNQRNRKKRGTSQGVYDVLTLTTRKHDTSVNIKVQSISPNKGPQSGGTNIEVQGTFGVHQGSVILEDDNSVTFVEVDTWDEKSVKASTGYSFSMNGSRTITVSQSTGNIHKSNVTFEYLPDPVVTNCYPTTTMVAGGITLTVEGRGFSYVSKATLYIDMETRREGSDGTYTVQDTETFESEPGTRLSDSMYVFTTPEITLPESFQPSKRKKRAVNDDIVDSVYLQFFAGVKLDGVEEYRNFTDSVPNQNPLTVVHNPQITRFNETREYNNATETFIDIKGKYLSNTLGKSAYRVTLGVSECNVTEILDNQIICIPPNTEPDVVRTGAYKEGLPRLMVYVGRLSFAVGHVDYISTDYKLYIIIGVVLGAILISTIIFGTIICHCKRKPQTSYAESMKRKTDDKEFEIKSDQLQNNDNDYEGLGNRNTSGSRSRMLSNHSYEDTTLQRDRSLKYDQSYAYDNNYDNNIDQGKPSTIEKQDEIQTEEEESSNKATDSIFWEVTENGNADAAKLERQNSNMVQIRQRLMSAESYQDKSLSLARTFSYDNDLEYDNNFGSETQKM